MSDSSSTAVNTSTPKHLWGVGVFALLWSAMGAFDYLMTHTQNQEYMSAFTAEQLEFFYNMPSWTVAFWALAVWCGVLGGLFLLMKKRQAVTLFLVSLVSFVITVIRNYGLANGLDVIGGASSLVLTAAIFIFALLFYLYAKSMAQKGVLT